MKLLVKLLGFTALATTIGGSVYALSGEEALDKTNSAYFLVSLNREHSSSQKPHIIPPSNSKSKDYNCQLNPPKITVPDAPNRSEHTNVQPPAVESCQLIKVNFSDDKHVPIYWDELKNMKNGTAITQYEEFTKTTRTGYNNADEWYILQVNKKNKSIFSNTQPESFWSVNHKTVKSNLFLSIYGEITDNGFVGHSKYAIAKFEGLSKPEDEEVTKLTSLSNAGGGTRFTCNVEAKNLTTTKNKCDVIETSEKDDIKNIKFKDIKFPNFSNGVKLQTLTVGNFYLIDMLKSSKSSDTKIYMLDDSETDPNKKLATFEFQSIFLGNTSNLSAPEEIIILQQNKNNN